MTKQEILRNFADNVEEERHKLGLTQAQMAKKLEMSTSGYKKMISGETSRIDIYVLYLMYNLTGRLFFEMINMPVAEESLIRELKGLTFKQIEFVQSIVNFERLFLADHADDAKDWINVIVPTGNMEDGMIWDSFNYEKVNVASYRKKFGNSISCGIKVTSNHLHPVYHMGDILLVCQKPIRDGDTGIFINRKEGRVYIRKLSGTHPCILEPINGFGKNIIIDSLDESEMNNWIKFGYVLTKMRE